MIVRASLKPDNNYFGTNRETVDVFMELTTNEHGQIVNIRREVIGLLRTVHPRGNERGPQASWRVTSKGAWMG